MKEVNEGRWKERKERNRKGRREGQGPHQWLQEVASHTGAEGKGLCALTASLCCSKRGVKAHMTIFPESILPDKKAQNSVVQEKKRERLL